LLDRLPFASRNTLEARAKVIAANIERIARGEPSLNVIAPVA
jgi:hypothetical protein